MTLATDGVDCGSVLVVGWRAASRPCHRTFRNLVSLITVSIIRGPVPAFVLLRRRSVLVGALCQGSEGGRHGGIR
ncbi:hypothetical protein C791_4677 [Amycolatopsis azurea DSM 43854]|uniref:Uncharacterized protein n=1 Tax=Amycolatopsis azurea DSM 43854 TaxID=1238180 RepID=M2QI26_9PSEU|nr:hypothetical protein C791_4677 [Amycolatopsis azurea DSM 43854]